MHGHGRDILLLAAEDAFEFERWRDAGPLTADIDAEVSAAEIAEFEALGVPMPRELDSLKREMEHAPKVREAIRNSALALRRSGRASSAALVALAPTGLVHPAMMDPRFAGPMGMGMDPRFVAQAQAQAQAARVAGPAHVAGPAPEPAHARRLAGVTVMADGDPVEAELVDAPPRSARRPRRAARVDAADEDDLFDDGFDDEDEDELDEGYGEDEDEDEEEREREREARARRKRQKQRSKARAKPRRERDWDEDFDDDDDSVIAAVPVGSGGQDRTTLILGGIACVALIALLWVTLGDKGEGEAPTQVVDAQQQQQQQQPQPPAPPPPAPTPAIDPNTGLPYGQAPAPLADAGATPSAAPSARRGGGGGGGGSRKSGSSSPSEASPSAAPGAAGALGGLSELSDVPGQGQTAPAGGQTPPAGGQTAPAGGQTAPAGGQTPPAGGQTPPAGDGGAPAGGQTAPAGGQTPPAGDGGAPAPAPAPAPEEDLGIPKSAPGPAITQYATSKVNELFKCLEDAQVAKPDLGGLIKFTITVDGEGNVTEVQVPKDEVGYGVAKCCKSKIKRWHVPAPGLPKRFDLPFQF